MKPEIFLGNYRKVRSSRERRRRLLSAVAGRAGRARFAGPWKSLHASPIGVAQEQEVEGVLLGGHGVHTEVPQVQSPGGVLHQYDPPVNMVTLHQSMPKCFGSLPLPFPFNMWAMLLSS